MKFETFSQREARKKGEFPPEPASTSFSAHLRRTITDIFDEVFGMYYVDRSGISWETVETTKIWDELDRLMRRESAEYSDWGYSHRNHNPRKLFLEFVLNASDWAVLDALDLAVSFCHRIVPDFQRRNVAELQRWNVQLTGGAALSEIDLRLREAGTIYRVADGKIVVSTDDFTHEDIVMPALRALGEPGFENALKEFHDALDAYRKGDFEGVLTKANHAFESTMKIIAGKLRWTYDANATAAPMLELLVKNGLLPEMRQAPMRNMIEMMKCDVPRLRNAMPSAGHGAGEKAMGIPEEFATYATSAAAANIRLLVDCYRAKLPKKKKG
jgi:hypothetical protein